MSSSSNCRPHSEPTGLAPWRQESWRVAASYLIPLLVVLSAREAGFNPVVVMATGLTVALTHWLLPPLSTTFFCMALGYVIALLNSEKLRINGDGILWQDFVYVLPNIPSNVGTVLQYAGYAGLTVGALAASAWVITFMLERKHLRASLPFGVIFSITLVFLNLNPALAYVEYVRRDIRALADSPQMFAGELDRSSIARFFHSTSLPPADFKTNGTSSSLFRQLTDKLRDSAHSPDTDAPPDIFAILNESQFDPTQLAVCAGRNDCRLSMYANAPYSVARGPLRVHTHGWGTWNAEFTLMTGVPYYWFGESGFYSPYTVAPGVRLALAKQLSSLGYRTIAVYPTQKGMLNAASAYRNYGVEEFFGAEDLGLSFDWCQIPDSLMYEKLTERYRAAKDDDSRPIFMVMLTIFNHGPHGKKCVAPDLVSAVRQPVTEEALKLEDYLRRARESDAAAKAFRDEILASPRKALILFAGDHQPGFEGLHAAYPRTMHREMTADETYFFTGYQFFANYPISPSNHPETPHELDISFLGATLLELARLPLGPLFLPNRKLRDLCSGRLDNCPEDSVLDSYKSTLLENGFL